MSLLSIYLSFFPSSTKFSSKFPTYIHSFFNIKLFLKRICRNYLPSTRDLSKFSLMELTVTLDQAAEPNFTAVCSIYHNSACISNLKLLLLPLDWALPFTRWISLWMMGTDSHSLSVWPVTCSAQQRGKRAGGHEHHRQRVLRQGAPARSSWLPDHPLCSWAWIFRNFFTQKLH